MLLRDLIGDLHVIDVSGSDEVEIRSVVYDSRQAGQGSLFVALRGENYDGRQFVADAIRAGAVAVLCEQNLPEVAGNGVGIVALDNTRTALGPVSAKFYGNPSASLNLVGVTGTKGKTTTTHLISSIFATAGQKTGVIGTLGSYVGTKTLATKHTTPEATDLQATLAQMLSEGVQTVAMEVSSHGLAQHRVDGCEFDCGVFTNLTRDHLDYHSTMEEYLEAKLMLFRERASASRKDFTAVVNLDDPAASMVIEATRGEVMTYSAKGSADVTASNIAVSAGGLSYLLNARGVATPVHLKLGGLFNVYNSLAAGAAAIAGGLSVDLVAEGLACAPSVPGRFESVDCGQPFSVIVDYAHAPDALENVLRSAREIVEGKLIVAFGCGGNRDKGKRPMMGRIACELADRCVITSDNPRKEDPDAIIRDIMAGVDESHAAVVEVITDRRAAIRTALSFARPGDMVVIAGKGHETYQIFAEETIHFDDREVVREILCGGRT